MPRESAWPERLVARARVTLPGPYQGQDPGCLPTLLSTLCLYLALAGSRQGWAMSSWGSSLHPGNVHKGVE